MHLLKGVKMTFVNNNAPEALVELCKKWDNENKTFYLGPENIFAWEYMPVDYTGGESISKDLGSWSIHTTGQTLPLHLNLNKDEITEIATAFRQKSYPKSAQLFLSDRCCSSCIMCPYHGEDTEYFDKYLSSYKTTVTLEIAKQWVDKLCDIGIKNISIAAHGETLMLPYWEELMRYTAEKGLTQYFITNGMFFTEEVAKKLKEIGNVTCAEVSIHGTDFETWSSVTRIKNKKLFDNAINAPFLLKKHVTDNVYVAFVKTEKNIHNLKTFLDFWIPKSFNVTVLPRLEENDNFTYINNSFDPPILCADSGLNIAPNGDILPCSGGYRLITEDNKNSLGILNIKSASSEDILQYWRNLFNNKIFCEKICKHCKRYQRKGTLSERTTYYGYEAIREDIHYRVLPKHKKTFKQRIKNEYNSAKKKLTRLLK